MKTCVRNNIFPIKRAKLTCLENLRNFELNGQRVQTKTTDVAVSTAHENPIQKLLPLSFSVLEREDVASLDEERGGEGGRHQTTV